MRSPSVPSGEGLAGWRLRTLSTHMGEVDLEIL